MQNSEKEHHSELVGLLPAGGKAARVSPLPCSKEIYPIGFGLMDEGRNVRPKVVCHYLLEKMRSAGVTKAHIVMRKGKWDIPAYLGNGKILDIRLSYLMMDLPFGVPYTLDEAYPFIQDAVVAFGFPDIIFEPGDAFVHLLSQRARSNADVVLGLFPARKPEKVDMVELGADGRVQGIQIKPTRTHLRYAWLIAVWTPDFTRFMHEYLTVDRKRKNDKKLGVNHVSGQELFIGDVIQSAIEHDLRIDSVVFTKGEFLDIGTPEDIVKAIQIKT